MNLIPWQASEVAKDTILQAPRRWFFAKWLAALAFLAGGAVAFYFALCAFVPPQQPPTGGAFHGCGHAALGAFFHRVHDGWRLIVLGTPLAAIASSLAGALIGGVLDCVVDRRRRTGLDAEPTRPPQ
jgi:hypothetical protein